MSPKGLYTTSAGERSMKKMGDLTWSVPTQLRRLVIASRRCGVTPPRMSRRTSNPSRKATTGGCMCICCRVGTNTTARATHGPTPSHVRAFSPSLLLVQPCEAQRRESLRASISRQATGDEKEHAHNRRPRSACCSPPPSADAARAGTQRDPKACRSDTAPTPHHVP